MGFTSSSLQHGQTSKSSGGAKPHVDQCGARKSNGRISRLRRCSADRDGRRDTVPQGRCVATLVAVGSLVLTPYSALAQQAVPVLVQTAFAQHASSTHADRPQLQSLVATVAQDARALGQVDDPQVAAPANPSGATPSIQSVPSSAADAPLAPPLGSQEPIGPSNQGSPQDQPTSTLQPPASPAPSPTPLPSPSPEEAQKNEEEQRKSLRKKRRSRIKELEDTRAELVEKQKQLLEREKELLDKDQTVSTLREELDLEKRLRGLLTKEKDKAEEQAALAMGLCTGAFSLP